MLRQCVRLRFYRQTDETDRSPKEWIDVRFPKTKKAPYAAVRAA